MAGSTIGAMLNQATATGGEIVAESFRTNRFAWEVAAIAGLLGALPLGGMVVGEVFGSSFFGFSRN